jgi:hypothetical protein
MEEVEEFEVDWDYVESTDSMDVVTEKTCDSGSVASSYELIGVRELSGQGTDACRRKVAFAKFWGQDGRRMMRTKNTYEL